jgi:trimethylamine:corrinoid methyltransferase-like protein
MLRGISGESKNEVGGRGCPPTSNQPELISGRLDKMSKPRISFLSENEIEAIHDASLRVLEKTGIKVMSKVALDILKKAGAKVDYEIGHANLHPNLVEEALKMAPRTVKYCARNPKYDFVLNKQKTHFCAEGGSPFLFDWETGKRRYSTSEDIAKLARIADYLDHFDLIWPLGTSSEVPAPVRYIVDMYTGLRNCWWAGKVEGKAYFFPCYLYAASSLLRERDDGGEYRAGQGRYSGGNRPYADYGWNRPGYAGRDGGG